MRFVEQTIGLFLVDARARPKGTLYQAWDSGNSRPRQYPVVECPKGWMVQ